MKKHLVKKKHFFFGLDGSAFLIFDKTHSNIFVTLLDSKMKVIICKTSGSSNVGFSKKKKKAPAAVENIIKSLDKIVKLYRIKSLDIILRFKITNHFLILMKELSSLGITIRRFLQRLRIGHNGMRGRKPRRV
jgi:ribosomal protein S11